MEFEERSEGVDRYMAAAPFGTAEPHGDGWRIDLAPGADVRTLLAELNTLDVPLARFEREQPSLHEIFVSYAGSTAAAPQRRPETTHV